MFSHQNRNGKRVKGMYKVIAIQVEVRMKKKKKKRNITGALIFPLTTALTDYTLSRTTQFVSQLKTQY